MSDRRLLLLPLLPALMASAQEDPRAMMMKARALQLRGGGNDPKAAVEIYRRVLILVPQSAEAELRLSEALQESGQMELALTTAKKAVELAPDNTEAQAHLALLSYAMSQQNPALAKETQAALATATAMLPGDPELWARLGEVAEGNGDKATALKAWLRLGRLRPTFLPAWERAAVLAKELNDYDARREAIMALNARNPNTQQLRMLEDLAREQIEAGFLAHAEESFLLLAKYFPEEGGIYENIALIQLQTKRYAEALATFKKAEVLKPTPRISFNIAFAEINLGQFPDAEKRLKVLVDRTDLENQLVDNAQSLYCQLLLLEGRPEALLDYLKDAPSTPRLASERLMFKIQALIQRKDWKAAAAAIREGIASYDKVPFFQQAGKLPAKLFEDRQAAKKDSQRAMQSLDLVTMAAYWGEFQRWPECLAAIKKARSLGPVRDVNLLLLESSALESTGHVDEALKSLREAQKLEPGNSFVENNLGYLLLEKGGDLNEAAQLIEAAAKQSPENGSVVDSLGWAQYKQGKYKEAEVTLQKAVKLSPFSPEARKHLGEVLLKLGRPEEAAEQWERALAFVFPDRKQLENRLSELRLSIAKEQAEKSRKDGEAKDEKPGDAEDASGEGDEE